MSAAGDVASTIFFVVVVLLLIGALIWLFLYVWRKLRERGVRHVELYFDEHFRDIVKEWDLVTTPSMKDWTKDMSKRLDYVGKDIDKMMDFKKSFDTRLNKLESELDSLEVS
ncbi:MAG: hypothetical protein JSV49_10665 [Thermoplasmata archaeon]|nr:MAG: hypothetical protein JSV49_10665 [Thermoplasmata archaeon]